MDINVLFIQYAGDFRETLNRREKGLGETYYAQDYTVDYVINLAKILHSVSVLCVTCEEKYDEVSSVGVRVLSTGLGQNGTNIENLIKYTKLVNPTHIILRFPNWRFIKWLNSTEYKVLPVFADSWQKKGLKQCISLRILSYLLNRPKFEWVANHQINAARSLINIGVKPSKVIPYDWEHYIYPQDYNIKTNIPDNDEIRLSFVGQVINSKGIGDLIQALYILDKRDISFLLNVAGVGEIDRYKSLVNKLGLGNKVNFLGRIEHKEVIKLVRESHISFVLSHWEYPEGLPMTIMEAYAVRTPIITTNHPMFKGKVVNEECALVVNPKSPEEIAESIIRLVNDDKLYEKLSKNTLERWKKLELPVKWADIIDDWLDIDKKNINKYTLKAYDYDEY